MNAGAIAWGQGGAPKEMLPFLSLQYYTTQTRLTDRSVRSKIVCALILTRLDQISWGVIAVMHAYDSESSTLCFSRKGILDPAISTNKQKRIDKHKKVVWIENFGYYTLHHLTL